MAALNNPRCIFNTRAALQRVFLSTPTGLEAAANRTRQLAVTPDSPLMRSHGPSTPGNPLSGVSQVRSFTRPPRGKPRSPQNTAGAGGDETDGYSRLFTTAKDLERAARDRMPQDFEIKDPKIMVLENGSVEGPLSTKYVLSKLDEKTESLRMIRPYIPRGTPLKKLSKGELSPEILEAVSRAAQARQGRAGVEEPKTEQEQFALCQIVNKYEEFLKDKERKERKKANVKPKSKDIELTWSIGEHDLQTKLKRMMEFLGKGMKVSVVLGKKKGSKPVEDAVMRDVLKRVKVAVQEMDAREAKPPEGELGATMRLYFEGVVKKEKQQQPAKEQTQE